jgi:CRP/FNR family transcriptional regulator, cyclic AMP receptor protein
MGSRERLTLARFEFFKSLEKEAIRGLDEKCRWQRFEPGATILEFEERSTDVYFVASGVVRVWLPTTRRTDVILADMGEGAVFGELAAIDGRPRSASVSALSAALVGWLPSNAFRSVLVQHFDACDQLLRWLAVRSRNLTARVSELSTLSVPDRVRAELLRLGRLTTDQPNRAIISPPPTQSELAGRISTHREAVSRELAALERDGLLERRRGAFVLCDVAALADALERAGARCLFSGGYADAHESAAGSRRALIPSPRTCSSADRM